MQILKILHNDLGIHGVALQWFASYLTKRSHKWRSICSFETSLWCASMIRVSPSFSALTHSIRPNNPKAWFTVSYICRRYANICFNVNDAEHAIKRLEQCVRQIRSWMVNGYTQIKIE